MLEGTVIVSTFIFWHIRLFFNFFYRKEFMESHSSCYMVKIKVKFRLWVNST